MQTKIECNVLYKLWERKEVESVEYLLFSGPILSRRRMEILTSAFFRRLIALDSTIIRFSSVGSKQADESARYLFITYVRYTGLFHL